tara:strand:- start:2841 stop:3014 length:174 start_codon:yes stop_codon:yes gene_type:complete
MMNDNNTNVILFSSGILAAILLTVVVNLSSSDYSGGSNYSKQETYFRLQQRPSKLIQ